MDYNNGNNNNMNMPNPNMINPGMGNPNMGHPGMGNPNMGHPGMGNPNMGNPNMGHPGMGNPNMGHPGMGNPNMGNPNMPDPRMGNPGMGVPGMANPNMGRPGMGTPGMGNPGMQGPGPGRQNPGISGAGRQGLGRFGAPGQGNLSHADLASNRLAKEIEKSVNGERKAPEHAGGHGLRRAGRPGLNAPAFALPAGLMEGISGLSAYIFGGILILCLIVSLAAYGKGHKGGSVRSRKASIPVEMFTYTGIFRNAYEAAASGSLSGAGTESGALYNDDGTMVPAAPTAIGEKTPAATDPDDYDPTAAASSEDTASSDGESSSQSGDYGQAESYKELLDQLEKAIASGDSAFVASKMAYEDEGGTLKAFPQTVVDHFVSYMSTNTDKLSSLMTDLSSDKYSGQNNGEFIVKLPYIKFVVNMGYDNTTVAIPGFSEQVVNAGQSADIAPLMPCMYTLTISNPDWNDVVTRDIEANINESTISINIKP